MSDARSPGTRDDGPAFGADITNCDREPIHIPGSVQPHGALLAVDPKDLLIIQAGGDTPRILGAKPIELLTTNLSDRFAPDRVSQLRTLLDTEGPLIRPLHAFSIASNRDGEPVDTFVYRSGRAWRSNSNPWAKASTKTLSLSCRPCSLACNSGYAQPLPRSG